MKGSDYPERETVIAKVASTIYGGKILNNSHRGDVVEMMVLLALGDQWRFVGLGWHPWDLQRGSGENRIRIQVKQSASIQIWGPTIRPTLTLNWSKAPPEYFRRYNPYEAIEDEGWFCDIFVFGIHDTPNPETADHADPRQWRFLVIPVCELKPMTKSILLKRALNTWQPCAWHELSEKVEEAVQKLGAIGPS